MVEIVYFNGKFLPYNEVHISPEDRGYQFADGVYEVISAYRGKPFKLEEHFSRLARSASALEIELPSSRELMAAGIKLLTQLKAENAKLYIQVTRGTESRKHAYSEGLTPNIVMIASKLERHPEAYYQQGVSIITVPDERWSRCYIKSTALLPNILAKKQAKKRGAFEAVQVRDGFITEGTSSNIFIIRDKTLLTPPATNYILNGITRQTVLQDEVGLNLEVREESISLEELYQADEVFLTGTTTEIMPVIEIDGRKINHGKPGSNTGKLIKLYKDLVNIN